MDSEAIAALALGIKYEASVNYQDSPPDHPAALELRAGVTATHPDYPGIVVSVYTHPTRVQNKTLAEKRLIALINRAHRLSAQKNAQ